MQSKLVICDIPVQKLFVTGCTARGYQPVAWCMVRGHCQPWVKSLSCRVRWQLSTRSILDTMFYPNDSNPLRNVEKYSPNETASHPRGLGKSETALREPHCDVRLCSHVNTEHEAAMLQCEVLLFLSHSQTEQLPQRTAEPLGTLSKWDKSKQ
jgi:hypothetical protein